MFIAKVIGNVWSTVKHKSLENAKLLLIKYYDIKNESLNEEAILALDSFTGAGVGDIVLVTDEGSSARQILKNKNAPVRTIICGIIDEVYQDKKHYKKIS